MKKITIYLLNAIVFLASTSLLGQGLVYVKQETFALQGDLVTIEMTINFNNTQIPTNSFVLLTPALQSGSISMDLPSVLINGKKQAKKYNRLLDLKKKPTHIHSVINVDNKDESQTYKYTETIPYEPWMKTAKFIVNENQCECNGPLVPIAIEVVAKKMVNRNPPPYIDVEMNFMVSYIVPSPEPVKSRSESGKAYLDFKAGRSEILPEFGNNQAELDKIGDLVHKIQDNKYATITGISIEGYASPEGSSKANLNLSTNRAGSLKEYIRNNWGVAENHLKVSGNGEDWKTLETIIDQSDIANKDQILSIVRNDKQLDAREKQLKGLNRGRVFKNLLENVFPKLRRSDYELSYIIIPFTAEQGREVIKVEPSNLSLNEMFLVAETYPTDSPEHYEIFEIAATIYPKSNISNINAAANALFKGDTDMAQKYLSKVSEQNAAYLNNLGVLYALKGEYEKASKYFNSAISKGNNEAINNSSEIEKLNVK